MEAMEEGMKVARRALLPLLLVALIAAMLGLMSCTSAGSHPTVAPAAVLHARDTALRYVQDHFSTGIDVSLPWQESEVALSAGEGWTEYEYSAGRWIVAVAGPYADRYEVVVTGPKADDWIATVSFPAVTPTAICCHVAVENGDTGFVWEGDVDDAGHPIQTAAYSRAPWTSDVSAGGT
jgi:hypothetical protein